MSELIFVIGFNLIRIFMKLYRNTNHIYYIPFSLCLSFIVFIIFKELFLSKITRIIFGKEVDKELNYVLFVNIFDLLLFLTNMLYKIHKLRMMILIKYNVVFNKCNICYDDCTCLQLKNGKMNGTCYQCNFIVCQNCYKLIDMSSCPQCNYKNEENIYLNQKCY